MAFQNYFPEEDEARKTGSSSGVVTGNPNLANAGQAGTNTGSGFVNLDKYLSANQGQAGGLADDVIGSSESDVDQFKKDADKIAKDAKNEYQQAANTGRARGIANKFANDPRGAVKEAKGFLDEDYSATSADDYTNPLISRRQNLSENLSGLDNRYEQQARLKNKYNTSGNYTSGFGALDTFLLGADENSGQRIQNVKARASELDPAYQSVYDSVRSEYDQSRNNFADAKKNIRDTASNRYNDYKTDVDQRSAQEYQSRNAALDEESEVLRRYIDYALQNDLDAQLMLPGNAAQYVVGGDRYAQGDFVSDDELADLQALNSLADPDNPISYQKSNGENYDAFFDWRAARAGYGPNAGSLEYDYDPTSNMLRSRVVRGDGSAIQDWQTKDLPSEIVEYLNSMGY